MEASPSHPDPRTGDAALSFAGVADAYDRARPSYPREAVEWLLGPGPLSVVELGAGTGKLTDHLVALGHDVFATDPLEEMLAYLRLRHPDLRVANATAEQIPVATRSVDVVVAAQSFHWFDLDKAMPEIARVLKPEGTIALVWNRRDDRIPWVRRLGEIIGPVPSDGYDPSDDLVASRRFGYVTEASFRFWQTVRKDELRDLVRSRSRLALMDPLAQDRVLRRVDDLFDEYDRNPGGLRMPYVTRCFKAVVRPRGDIEEPEHSADLTEAARLAREAARGARRAGQDDDPAATLIDFR